MSRRARHAAQPGPVTRLELRRRRMARWTAGWLAGALALFGGTVAWAAGHPPRPAHPTAASRRASQADLPPELRQLLQRSQELDQRLRAAEVRLTALDRRARAAAGQAAALPPPPPAPSLPSMPQVQTTTA